jgi:endoglucanase
MARHRQRQRRHAAPAAAIVSALVAALAAAAATAAAQGLQQQQQQQQPLAAVPSQLTGAAIGPDPAYAAAAGYGVGPLPSAEEQAAAAAAVSAADAPSAAALASGGAGGGALLGAVPAAAAAADAPPRARAAAAAAAAVPAGACFAPYQQCGGNVTNAQTPCAALPGGVCTTTAWQGTCCPPSAPCRGIGTDTCWSCGGQSAPFLAESKADDHPVKCAERDASGEFDYACVAGASFLFYEAQRAGKLPARGNRVPWRGDSSLRDAAPNGAPLVRGYYDAGDLNKFTFPLAFTLSTLALGAVELQEAYGASGERDNALAALRWGADWLVAAHYEPGALVAAAVLPGDTIPEAHAFWGRPEDLPGPSQVLALSAKQPGADLFGASAAALASASVAFQEADPAYSEQLLSEARTLYAHGTDREGRHTVGLPQLRKYYESFTHLDDLALAAAWLGRRTGEREYWGAARQYLQRHQAEEAGGDARRFDWNNVGQAAGYLVGKEADARGDAAARDRFTQPIREGMDKWLRGADGVAYLPNGLGFLDAWGNLRFVANQALMGLLHNRLYRGTTGVKKAAERATAYACFARKQLRLMLGANDEARSYVVGVGFGTPPCAPHHRGATCGPLDKPCDCTAFSSPGCNPAVVYGALVGGPDRTGVYSDKRWDFQQAEVAIDYNAGFTGAVVALMPEAQGGESVTWRDCEKAGQADGRGQISASLNGAGGGGGRGGGGAAALAAAVAAVAAALVL